MGSWPLELTVISAKGLKDIGKLSKMDVYVAVTINGDPRTEQKTPVDQDGGSSPKWSHPMKFNIDRKAAEENKIKLDFRLRHERVLLGDKDVGEVHIPIKELLDKAGSGDKANSVLAEFPVRTSSGKERGKLKISYKLGSDHVDQFKNPAGYPVTTPPPPPSYPPPGSAMPPPGTNNYPPPGSAMPPPGTNNYPPPGSAMPPPETNNYPPNGSAIPPPGMNYPPPGYPQAPAGYPHAPAGYPAQPAGYPMPGPGASSYGYPPAGYGPPPPPQYGGYAPPPGGYPYYQQQPPKKSGMGGMGMGAAVGAGVLGGVVGALVLDDIVSDGADDFDCDF